MRLKRLGVILVTGFVLLCISFDVNAMGLTPESSDLYLLPGEEKALDIVVTNTSAQAQEYSVEFMKVDFGERAEDLNFSALTEAQSAWLSAEPNNFVLQSGSEQSIKFRVKIPNEVVAQALTVAVLVKEENGAGGGIRISSAGTSLVFLHLGELKAAAHLMSFEVLPRRQVGQSVTISALFKNTSEDSMILPNDLRVTNMFGQEVGRFGFSMEPKHLPAGTMRSLTTSWSGATSGVPSWLFGDYRFALYVNDELVTQTIVFICSPLALATCLVIVLGFIGILSLRVVLRKNKQDTR